MENDIILITKTIENNDIKIIFNDSNIFISKFANMQINGQLNLIPSIDLFAAIDILNKSESIEALETELINNSWIRSLKGFKN